MLSYQHIYHAGNHADVVKHILLGDIATGMLRKDKPIFMLDAFASRGIYDLDAPEALKNREFETGVGRLWALHGQSVPAGVQRWFARIAAENSAGGFTRLPGSTALLQSMLRPGDRLAACDLHPQEFDALRRSFRHGRNCALHKRDAFEALKALLPPKEKRGLIFLDPSYEVKQEYADIASAVAAAYKNFTGGVYVIWYPLLPANRHLALFQGLKRAAIQNILRLEVDLDTGCIADCATSGIDMQMYGSGLLVVNPPWHARQNMVDSLNWLATTLGGTAAVSWLTPER